MGRTAVKFCGIMRAEDAAAAVDAGADAVGLIFVPGADRRVSVEHAEMILERVGPFTTVVGVFADAAADEMLRVTKRLAIGTVQLHGHESTEIVQSLGGLRIIKAIHPDDESFDPRWLQPRIANVAGLLFEGPGPGGSGVPTNWDKYAVNFAEWRHPLPPLVMAGGLRSETVGEVIHRFRPAAVDVSSGIESARGIKSVQKMRAFIAAARAADSA